MHRHFGYKGRKLSRKAGPRKALLKNLTSQVILHEQITTTLEKAKEVRPILEKIITKAKSGTLADRRNVVGFLSLNDKAVEKLFSELGPLYKERNGGYTRIIKLGNRKGDNAEMAQISLLDTEKLTEKAMSKERGAKNKKKTLETAVSSVKGKAAPKTNESTKPKARSAKQTTKEKK